MKRRPVRRHFRTSNVVWRVPSTAVLRESAGPWEMASMLVRRDQLGWVLLADVHSVPFSSLAYCRAIAADRFQATQSCLRAR